MNRYLQDHEVSDPNDDDFREVANVAADDELEVRWLDGPKYWVLRTPAGTVLARAKCYADICHDRDALVQRARHWLRRKL